MSGTVFGRSRFVLKLLAALVLDHSHADRTGARRADAGAQDRCPGTDQERWAMAIALMPKFPIPDRSKLSILGSTRDSEDGVIEIGWCDGVLSDGRAFRAEMWAHDQVSYLTIFFSTLGIENLNDEEIRQFIQRERLVTFAQNAPQHCAAHKFDDFAGNELWSVSVTVGGEETTYLAESIPIFPYSKIGEPNTMFNPVPIKAAHRV
jgi:hypothetical protein